MWDHDRRDYSGKYESELEDLLPDDEDAPITEEHKELVDESEQVSSEVDEYIYKSHSGSSKKNSRIGLIHNAQLGRDP